MDGTYGQGPAQRHAGFTHTITLSVYMWAIPARTSHAASIRGPRSARTWQPTLEKMGGDAGVEGPVAFAFLCKSGSVPVSPLLLAPQPTAVHHVARRHTHACRPLCQQQGSCPVCCGCDSHAVYWRKWPCWQPCWLLTHFLGALLSVCVTRPPTAKLALSSSLCWMGASSTGQH